MSANPRSPQPGRAGADARHPGPPPPPLDALDDAERRRVLQEFALQAAPAPDFVALPERIARQALSCPDAVALRFRGRELSYRELDLRARRWAAVLRRHGAGPETAVVLCLPRCFAEVVALLAILYTGAAFVPLDPEHPEQRLRDMLEDVGPRAVLSTTATLDKLRRAAGPGTPVLALADDGHGDGDDHAVQPAPGPLQPTGARQLAYILFTSGSTGRPKGVQIEHRGLSNHVAWVLDTLRATSRDVFLQSGSAAFDGSLWSFFAPLCCGARMVLAAPEEQADPRLLEALMRAEQVSIAKFVPSTLRLLLEHARPDGGHALRQLACGGEVLDATLAARVFRTFRDACLHNFYGPTEASVVSTAMQVTPRDLDQATVSIGRPVPGMRAYVLDEAMRPLPVGAVGELFVGGIGLARGYLGRPELDAQRFVEPAWLPGERLYRTGDLVRWLADGRLGFLGRGDDQVKLRGLRIELGEIEAALLALPGVRQAAALVLGSPPGEQQLVAFVTGPARDAREPRMWREQLARRLPLYMLPSRFVFLDAFETLRSGKIDRRALAAQHAAIGTNPTGPEARHGDPGSQAARHGPRSALESALLDIWRAVLERDDIDPEHDFFDLGGHSLHATRMVSRVRATLGIGLALREVFDKPTLRELAAELELRLGAGEAGQALPPIQPVGRSGLLPLSFSQRRMWLEHQLDPRGAAYNVYSALRLRGELDREALQRALDALCARHEAFRTRIVFEHGEPHAMLGPVCPATLRLLQTDESAATERVAACAAEPFDLEHGPLHRFALARLGEHEHLLLLVVHHIVTDDWSRGIVLADLERLYALARRGESVTLPPRPIDFVDFAAWQRAHVDEASQQAQLQYWMQRLDGAPAPALPSDTARSSRDDNRGGHVALPLPRDWIDAVQRESARLDATPFMLLLAVFQSMLGRWCAQDDVCVAFPIANRTRVEAEGVVGSLVNTLLMRSQVDPTRGFRDFLQAEVRPAVLGAFAHQDLPFDHLVKQLRRHGSARPGDVRVLFNVLNTPRQPLRFDGLQADYVELDLGTTQFDLSLGIDLASRKVLSLSYASQLFQRATIEALGRLFLLGVERALRHPDAPLHTLWVAAPDELERLARWNAPLEAPAGAADQTLPALLAGSRASHDAAVRDAQGGTLSHAQLWQRAAQLADRLRAQGIGRGCLVGLGLPRSADMLAAQLAIWQCGAAYVPLDPGYPQARLRDMIDDARLSLLLCTRAQRADWSAHGVPLLEVDAAESATRAPASAPPQEGPRPEDPAYVIYTSGSTGKPKGVVVPHRGVVNFLRSMLREPGMRPGEVLLAVTTLSFDIAVLELLLPLCAGACVAIASPEEAADAGALQRRMMRERPTLMQATPATWRMLVEAGWPGDPGLRALVGGEALARDLADAMLPRCAGLWNMYGPTETTVWSSCWRVEPAPAPVRIGRPIANTRFHVLDPWGDPSPIGFGGELCIAGAGVASGYLRRPQLTAERFVDDPQIPGLRMYRTGDRGRWTHEGLLEHQGRLDHQVKLRGFRIELGEIESHLQAHPDVAQCLAMVREDSPGDQRLTAYVVPREGAAAPASSELREWLRARLPAYMVPQQVVELAQLPRLPNGKVRRDALPAPRPDPASPMPGAGPAWATPAERELAAVWAEVLGVAPTARSDNFFDLGGHSLLAQRVIVEFARRGGPRLSPRRLVQESLGQLAAGVELAAAAPAPHQGPATRRRGVWAALRARLGL